MCFGRQERLCSFFKHEEIQRITSNHVTDTGRYRLSSKTAVTKAPATACNTLLQPPETKTVGKKGVPLIYTSASEQRWGSTLLPFLPTKESCVNHFYACGNQQRPERHDMASNKHICLSSHRSLPHTCLGRHLLLRVHMHLIYR